MTGQEFRIYYETTLKCTPTEIAVHLKVSLKTIYNWQNMAEIPMTLELALPELTRRMRRYPQSEAV